MWNKYKYHLSIAASGFCYSTLSLFTALLTNQKVDAFTQIFWRSLIGAATCLFAMTVFFKQKLRIKMRELLYILVNALILTGGFITMNLTIFLGTPIAKAVALIYTYPLTLVPLSYVFLKDKPTFKQITAIVIALISIGMLLEVWSIKNIAQITLGELMAFANSVFYSAIIIFGRVMRTRIRIHPTTVVSYSLILLIPLLYGVGFILTQLGIPIIEPVVKFNLPPESWMSLLGLGFVGTTLAMTFLYTGLSKIKPSVAGLLLTTELLWATVWGYLIFQQMITIWGILGILGIIAAVLMV